MHWVADAGYHRDRDCARTREIDLLNRLHANRLTVPCSEYMHASTRADAAQTNPTHRVVKTVSVRTRTATKQPVMLQQRHSTLVRKLKCSVFRRSRGEINAKTRRYHFEQGASGHIGPVDIILPAEGHFGSRHADDNHIPSRASQAAAFLSFT